MSAERFRICRQSAAAPAASIADVCGTSDCLLKGLPRSLAAAIPRNEPGRVLLTFRDYPRHLVDLTTSFEDYLAKFSAKTRSTIRRKLRKFEELSGGAIDWREFRLPAELEAFFPLAREVSVKTYQERLLHAGLPDTPAFKSAALEEAAKDRIRAYILFLNKEPISYLYLPVRDGRAIYAFLGYDPAQAEHSPGTVLQMLALKRLFADPDVKIFDFTEGAGQHKQLFATHTDQCVDILVLRPGSKTLAIARAHSAFVRFEAALGRCLEWLGIKRTLKKLMRRLGSSHAQ